MKVEQMRRELARMYAASWKEKVLKMSDVQVVAIYRKFQKEGKIR
jgi:predicted acetyltransferase